MKPKMKFGPWQKHDVHPKKHLAASTELWWDAIHQVRKLQSNGFLFNEFDIPGGRSGRPRLARDSGKNTNLVDGHTSRRASWAQQLNTFTITYYTFIVSIVSLQSRQVQPWFFGGSGL